MFGFGGWAGWAFEVGGCGVAGAGEVGWDEGLGGASDCEDWTGGRGLGSTLGIALRE